MAGRSSLSMELLELFSALDLSFVHLLGPLHNRRNIAVFKNLTLSILLANAGVVHLSLSVHDAIAGDLFLLMVLVLSTMLCLLLRPVFMALVITALGQVFYHVPHLVEEIVILPVFYIGLRFEVSI